MGKKLPAFWLDDGDEWETLRQRMNNRSAPKVAPRKKNSQQHRAGTHSAPKQPKITMSQNVNLSVNLSVPKFRLPGLKSLKLSRRQFGLATLASIIVIGIPLGYQVFRSNKNATDKKDVLAVVETKPDFDTLLPDGKSENTSSGQVAYDPTRKVASFTDKIGIVDVTVSQQPLPDNLKDDTDARLEKIAKDFNANEIINANPKAYLGTDITGPQTAIFQKNGLLIFILSTAPIEKSEWTKYILQLQ